MSRWSGIAALALLLALGLAWHARPATSASTGIRPQPVVLVSGRDDHGLLATPLVALTHAPGSTSPVAEVPDGTVTQVLEERGEWLRVQAVGRPQLVGWVNDYYLRGTAQRLDTGAAVQLVHARRDGGRVLVAVAPLAGPGGVSWITEAAMREIGAREGDGHAHVHVGSTTLR